VMSFVSQQPAGTLSAARASAGPRRRSFVIETESAQILCLAAAPHPIRLRYRALRIEWVEAKDVPWIAPSEVLSEVPCFST
jgi:hypothetical protein